MVYGEKGGMRCTQNRWRIQMVNFLSGRMRTDCVLFAIRKTFPIKSGILREADTLIIVTGVTTAKVNGG